jgi:hypothetical protein
MLWCYDNRFGRNEDNGKPVTSSLRTRRRFRCRRCRRLSRDRVSYTVRAKELSSSSTRTRTRIIRTCWIITSSAHHRDVLLSVSLPSLSAVPTRSDGSRPRSRGAYLLGRTVYTAHVRSLDPSLPCVHTLNHSGRGLVSPSRCVGIRKHKNIMLRRTFSSPHTLNTNYTQYFGFQFLHDNIFLSPGPYCWVTVRQYRFTQMRACFATTGTTRYLETCVDGWSATHARYVGTFRVCVVIHNCRTRSFFRIHLVEFRIIINQYV